MKIAQISTKTILLSVCLFLLQSQSNALANTSLLTAATLQEMTAAEVKEFNYQYQVEYSKDPSDDWGALMMMKNPYRRLIDAYGDVKFNDTLKRLYAKHDRFDECTGRLSAFIAGTASARALSEGPQGITKEEYFESESSNANMPYPFRKVYPDGPLERFQQLFISLTWKYRGKGKENVFVFFNECMSMSIALYEAEYDDSDEDEE